MNEKKSKQMLLIYSNQIKQQNSIIRKKKQARNACYSDLRSKISTKYCKKTPQQQQQKKHHFCVSSLPELLQANL